MKVQINDRNLWLNFHHLYYFMMVATEGSIAGAAARLGVGQPALSIQLKQFEETIGVKLFERAHKKLILTEHGKAALAYAREIFKLGGEMIETLYDQPTKERVHLQIGALDSIPKHLTALLAEKALATRKCTVSILEGKGDELLRELTQHRLDLLLTNRLPNTAPAGVYKRRIAKLPIQIFGTRNFLRIRRKFPESLQGLPFLLPTAESQVRYEIEHYCQLHGLKPDFIVESQDMMVQKLMALRGIGVMAAPKFVVKEYVESKQLYSLGALEGVFEELFLVAVSRKIENPMALHLLKTFSVGT